MPIYEYQCQACEHTEEVLQKVSDPAPNKCLHCEKTGQMSKKVSNTSFQLKGGGWYSDLYASPKKESDKKTDSSAKDNAKSTDKPAKLETTAKEASPKPVVKNKPESR